MSPERSKKINGVKVAEYYWAGKKAVYVDSRLVNAKFDYIVGQLEELEK